MRLWHKDLIPVLPRQQLLGQWRECCAIAKNIAVNGTPNHLLVNKVLEYPPEHFATYTGKVFARLVDYEYNCNLDSFMKYTSTAEENTFWQAWWDPVKVKPGHKVSDAQLFRGWHTYRYLRQCYYNLQEKYDCGGITEEEWQRIESVIAIK